MDGLFAANLQRSRGVPGSGLRPVLSIMVDAFDTADEEPRLYDQDLLYLTTVEGLSSFCESVYLIDAPYPWPLPVEAPLNRLCLSLELIDEMPIKKSKLLTLQKSFLESIRCLHGFGELFIFGIIDNELNQLLQDIWRHVIWGPTEHTAKRFIETCNTLSKEQYVLGRTKAMEAGLINDNRERREGGWGGDEDKPKLILKVKFLLCTSIPEFFEKHGEGKDALIEAVELMAAEPQYMHRAEILFQKFERIVRRFAEGSDDFNHSLLEVYWTELETEEFEENEEDEA
ncbi:hypothetical protein MMC18_002881 [Xylographa bjoerkii]|nr:hypothetical protein [Xylographa bjoerkii]